MPCLRCDPQMKFNPHNRHFELHPWRIDPRPVELPQPNRPYRKMRGVGRRRRAWSEELAKKARQRLRAAGVKMCRWREKPGEVKRNACGSCPDSAARHRPEERAGFWRQTGDRRGLESAEIPQPGLFGGIRRHSERSEQPPIARRRSSSFASLRMTQMNDRCRV